MRARQIGRVLGLQRSTVNSYLYSRRPGALGNEVYKDSNYGWHLKEPSVTRSGPKETPSSQPRTWATPPNPSGAYASSRSALDRYTSVHVTLQEAFKGVHKTFQDGDRMIEVDIAPRTRPGTQICLKGKGAVDHAVNRRGNLYCFVNLPPNAPMTLSGDDVIYRSEINSAFAAKGGNLEVLTLEGTAQVKVPGGVKTGSKLRVKQQGWPKANGSRGSQYIHLEVKASAAAVDMAHKKPEKSYSPEVIREVFRDPDYALLSDDEQGKLAELLEQAEQARQQRELAKAQKLHPLTVIRSGWFWAAVAMGGALTYGGLRMVPQWFPPPPVPVEQQAP